MIKAKESLPLGGKKLTSTMSFTVSSIKKRKMSMSTTDQKDMKIKKSIVEKTDPKEKNVSNAADNFPEKRKESKNKTMGLEPMKKKKRKDKSKTLESTTHQKDTKIKNARAAPDNSWEKRKQSKDEANSLEPNKKKTRKAKRKLKVSKSTTDAKDTNMSKVKKSDSTEKINSKAANIDPNESKNEAKRLEPIKKNKSENLSKKEINNPALKPLNHKIIVDSADNHKKNSKNETDSLERIKKKKSSKRKKNTISTPKPLNEEIKSNKKKKQVVQSLPNLVVPSNKKDSFRQKILTKKSEKLERQMKRLEVAPKLVVPSVKDFWSVNAAAFSMNVNQAQEEDSSSSDEEEPEEPKKKKKKLTAAEKVAAMREEEERIRKAETDAALELTRPNSSEHFERLMLANPNSSEVWIAYMAFYLQATEIDKARSVGRRALEHISFREEGEKLNVWLAMISFENSFGTQESQKATLEEALQMNDRFKVHSRLLDMYVDSNRSEDLADLAEYMLKKYKQHTEMFTLVGAACYKLDLKQKARFAMQKAIQALPKKEHIPVIVKFALMEHNHGDSERAETLLEQVVGTYPARVDVWSVYVDMLAKNKDIVNIRHVMERAVSHKIPARKMKTLFKKWIDVEEKIGSPDHIEIIREKALEFIKKAEC